MSTLIANPPRGIYKGPATIGQAAYHVWLDMQARFLSRSESVLLHARAHNAFGKRAEQLPGSPVEAGKAHLAVTLLQQDVRDTIDTRSKEVYVDDTPAIIEQARATLSKLIANGHVEELGGALILKTSSLQLQTKTLAALSKATIIPERLRKPLRDAVFEATDIQITTDTKYAPVWKNSNIAPLFVLASGWDAFSQYDKIIYATSHNTAVKYGLLRAAISAGSGQPG